MITMADADVAARLRRLRHQGMSVSDLERQQAERSIIEEYPEVGYNFRLSDIHAAIGLAQLAKLDGFIEKRRSIAARYDAGLKGLDGVETTAVPAYAEPNYQSYIVRIRDGDERRRNLVLDALRQRGIGVRRGLMAAHLEPCYCGVAIRGSLTHTEAAARQTIVLPIYQDLTEADQDYVVDKLREVLAG